MRHAIVLLLLFSCYKKSDAVKQLTDMGRPTPIACVRLNGNDGDTFGSFSCVDAAKVHWLCDNDGCIEASK